MPARSLRIRATTAGALAMSAVVLAAAFGGCGRKSAEASAAAATATNTDTVELKASQLGAIAIAAIGEHEFVYRREAVGIIDFDQNRNVQVFSPYEGRIIQAAPDLGDQVKQGQVLFTVESPDFIAAQASLIAAAATHEQTSSALERARSLYEAHGIDQNTYEAAVASQRTADGALRAARQAVAIFGKTTTEIDRIISAHRVENALVVTSPITGRITARTAAPGALLQPGSAPAPYAVADPRSKWMVANVSESDSPLLRVGQPIEARVSAYPRRVFAGRIAKLGRALDANTHRVVVRAAIADPQEELIAGMLASFAIQVSEPLKAIAIPQSGVVRNGDGSFSAWVTTDRRHFTERTLKLGEPLDGQYPVSAGLKRGELTVTDGAVFVSNILYAPPTD